MCRVCSGLRETLVSIVVCVALLLPLGACDKAAQPPDELRSVTLGVSSESLDALAYIARDEGLFEQEGLSVELIEFDSAQAALEAMLAGEVDAALCADTPIVTAAINGEQFAVIATVGADSNDLKVVARASSGISEPADLRGKRVGTRKGTAAHFFLHVLLTKYGMADADVDVRYDSFENVTAALISGELDAVSLRQPFIAQLRTALGDDFVLLEEDGLYGKTMSLCVPTSRQGADTDVQQRLIKAFISAEEAGVADKSGRLVAQLADDLGVQPADICSCIITSGAVGLKQSLVLNYEDQVRWAMECGLATAAEPPDMLLVIDAGPMDAVAPERVTLIR
jgi:NitT/TauT family transport system substrate-binding protein